MLAHIMPIAGSFGGQSAQRQLGPPPPAARHVHCMVPYAQFSPIGLHSMPVCGWFGGQAAPPEELLAMPPLLLDAIEPPMPALLDAIEPPMPALLLDAIEPPMPAADDD